jgi:1-acyl-sn-glycerol-3-phosphate acyltransferase
MARASLFKNFLFRALIRALHARPVERGASDIKAMRFALDLMKQGDSMLIFPEGTRSETGETLPFKSGMMLLVKRGNATIVPAAVEGTFGAWPRNQSLPKLSGRIGVKFGEPISAEQMLAVPADQALENLREKVESLRLEIAEQNRKR